MKLVWLLYQQRQRSSLAPLQKKSPFSPQMTMFLVEAAKWLVSSAVVVALCARSSTLFRPSVVMGALFFMSVSPFIGVLLESKEALQRQYHYHYVRLSGVRDDEVWQRLLKIHYAVSLLRLLPIWLPPSIGLMVMFGMMTGASFVWFGQTMLLLLYVISHIVRGSTVRATGVFSAVFFRMASFAIGYAVMAAIVPLLQLSRQAVRMYGLSLSYLAYMDGYAVHWQQRFYECMTSWGGWSFSSTSLSFIGAGFALLALICFSFIRPSHSHKAAYRLYSWYQRVIESLKVRGTNNAILYKDLCLFTRPVRELTKPPWSLFLPGEWFLVAGANVALLPIVHNGSIILFLFMFEMYIVMTGALRAITDVFRDIFQFESEMERLTVFRLLSPPPLVPLIEAKWTLLERLGVYPCMTAVGLLLLEYIGLLGMRGGLWAAMGAVMMMPAYSLVVKRILRTDYEVFCLVLASGEQTVLTSPRDYAGYMVIAAGNHSFHRLLIYITVFSSLLSAFFMLLKGWSWACYSVLFVVMIYLVLWNGSQYAQRT
ncbi:hypothetical protein B9L19_14800 [Geobacillus thermocatenulatus]|uniref:Uncharacterized protein n=2 Tax=Geobacillus thermocatenulatus TaxID=33938 RepID=A0A226Q343_9BACL|nr:MULTISPECIES: hypothetical protein [Geobacillus]AST00379.1 hypothetical protein GT3921_15905 [Geobacillus thermocatenulatus]KLR72379.1 hypothetical protein ABH20_16635 [Geobacillus sp. T6]OXB86756.1 hypothetical protein B9L19_14800 [Geobacillus thermocatenulatus]